VFGQGDLAMDALWFIAGPVTILPLVFFAAGAKRIDLSVLGFLQYLAPTMQFLLAVLAFGEPFAGGKAIAFSLIWVALIVFTVDVVRMRARRRDTALAATIESAAELE